MKIIIAGDYLDADIVTTLANKYDCDIEVVTIDGMGDNYLNPQTLEALNTYKIMPHDELYFPQSKPDRLYPNTIGCVFDKKGRHNYIQYFKDYEGVKMAYYKCKCGREAQ